MSGAAGGSGSAGTAYPGYITASGVYTITLATAMGTPSTNPDTFTVYNDRHRMVAALYTDGSSHIVAFSQNGDTFDLGQPVYDVNATIPVTPPMPLITLNSVPSGIVVEALGRCVAAINPVVLYTPVASYTSATALGPAPGYDAQTTLTPTTSYPYRLHTNTARQISGRAGGGPTNLRCLTDGWVWSRGK